MKKFAFGYGEKFILGLCVAILGLFTFQAFSLDRYDRKPEDFVQLTERANSTVKNSQVDSEELMTKLERTQKLCSTDEYVKEKKQELSKKVTAEPFGTPWRARVEFGEILRDQPMIKKPIEPKVQVNRGVIPLFRITENGEREVRKVQNGDEFFPADKRIQDLHNVLARDATGAEAYFPLFEGNQTEEGTVAAGGDQEEEADDEEKVRPGFNPVRIFDFLSEPREAKEGDQLEVGEMIDDWILDMKGLQWVEIISLFPHAEQIREYAMKLQEPAPLTGLRYAYVEVQRKEIGEDLEWTEWSPLSMEKQLDDMRNVQAFAPEGYQSAVNGLGMRIPQTYTMDKPDLEREKLTHLHEVEAKYTDEFLYPKSWARYQRQLKAWEKSRSRKFRAKPVFEKMPGEVEIEGDFDNKSHLDQTFLRFWDFTVEPGRRYIYRVRVHTLNPNFGRLDVVASEFAMEELLTGEWSEPSREVHIEPVIRRYLPKQRLSKTDSVTIEVHLWDKQMGEWLPGEFNNVKEGDIIGISSTLRSLTMRRWDPATLTWLNKINHKPVRGTFGTRTVVLDLSDVPQQQVGRRGGQRNSLLHREIIVTNAFGDLIRHRSIDDDNDQMRLDVIRMYKRAQEDIKKAEAARKEDEEGEEGEDKRNPDAFDPLDF